ncbi:cytochrome c oxidase assembly protein [Phyllobacterium endophyticum]|uniref:cytochrome c oxidase assembly protein n=1 Tax=Phyllobacterium endophyticum TaxID=1149773 RepID=UPI0011CA5F60|nr:cytochrome c oxidase assembly protein [Phyllobacterium endophyticum]TXR47829.1 cytochrome c oxidase assembly protein [Phyllobacterium endophyticum]
MNAVTDWFGANGPYIDTSRCFAGATVFGWTFDATVTLPLLITAALYYAGVTRLWLRAGRFHGASLTQVACFSAGWLVLATALVSPLHEASRNVFTAHMIEHELVMAVAAPLMVISKPLGPLLWALPQPARRRIGLLFKSSWWVHAWHLLTIPLVATALHGIAIWLWHLPAFFDAALVNEPLHWLQHASFLFSALLFWWSLFAAPAARSVYGQSIGHLFATAGHTSLLGLIFFLSPRILYPLQSAGGAAWGLGPLEDQQLAGLVMWIPSGLVYAGAALVCAALWISRTSATIRVDTTIRKPEWLP